MPIIAIFTGNGFTKKMYDALRKEVNWENEKVDGWIAHVVRFDDSGQLHMINIWESRDKMSIAFRARFFPIMQKIGIPEPFAEIYPAYKVDIF